MPGGTIIRKHKNRSTEPVPPLQSILEVDMRKACVVLLAVVLVTQCFAQQPNSETVTVSGCVMSVNGRFKLLTQGQTYVLKGQNNELFSHNGKLVEVTGTLEKAKSHSPGIPMILHVTSLKKLADTCT
jgi:hypothetical protein